MALTKKDLMEQLKHVPDHVPIYYMDRRVCRGMPAHFIPDELVPVTRIKAQVANVGITVPIAVFKDDGVETRRMEVTNSKIIFV